MIIIQPIVLAISNNERKKILIADVWPQLRWYSTSFTLNLNISVFLNCIYIIDKTSFHSSHFNVVLYMGRHVTKHLSCIQTCIQIWAHLPEVIFKLDPPITRLLMHRQMRWNLSDDFRRLRQDLLQRLQSSQKFNRNLPKKCVEDRRVFDSEQNQEEMSRCVTTIPTSYHTRCKSTAWKCQDVASRTGSIALLYSGMCHRYFTCCPQRPFPKQPKTFFIVDFWLLSSSRSSCPRLPRRLPSRQPPINSPDHHHLYSIRSKSSL